MDEKKLKKFKQVKEVCITDNFVAVLFKVKFFRVHPDELLEVFEYLKSEGFRCVAELGIDCNKFIFERIPKVRSRNSPQG